MQVSLVMPTWNAGPLLEEVLTAVDRQPGADQLERVAIDSGSRDDTVACLRRHGFQVETIPQSEFDHGATRDRAIERCRGEIIVLLTQDATPANSEWLPRLLESYADPKVAAAYCKQIPRPDCNPVLAARLAEWTAGKDTPVVQQVADAAEFAALPPLERLARAAYDNVAGSVRRSAWEQLRFGRRAFGEDVAFGKRALLAGWKLVFQARSVVIHSHNRSPRAEGRRIYCDHKNLAELFDLHTLPDRQALRAAIAWGREHFGKLVAGLGLPAAQTRRLHEWAMDYAWWSAVGQYLGGNAARLQRGPLGWVFRWADRWLARGI